MGNFAPLDIYGGFGHERILAASGSYARRFIEAGIPDHSVKVVGVPRFDLIRRHSKRERPSSTKPILMYVFQPFIRQERVKSDAFGTLRALADGLNQAYDKNPFSFMLREHPRDDSETIDLFLSLLSIPYKRSSASEDFNDLLERCNAVIGHYSTGLIEAVVMNIPVICVPIRKEHFAEETEAVKQGWFEASGCAVGRDKASICDAIVETLSLSQTNIEPDYLATEVEYLDGSATSRAADAIMDVLNGVHSSSRDMNGAQSGLPPGLSTDKISAL